MYREVTMIELREVLRLWQEHLPKKRIAARLGLDPKTVRRYLRAAEAAGLPAQPSAVSDEQLRDVLLALQPSPRRGLDPLPRTAGGDPALANFRIAASPRFVSFWARQGVPIAYPTLYRFARPGAAVWTGRRDHSHPGRRAPA